MVDKVHGRVQNGTWFSKDIAFVSISATGGDFVADEDGTNGAVTLLNDVYSVIATRGGVIGVNVTAATTIEMIVDYANSFADADVIAELVLELDAITGLSGSAITASQGFAQA